MIQANELRIGNWVFTNHYGNYKNIQIEGIHKNSINNHQSVIFNGSSIPIFDISPIQLTREWLFKFGFTLKNDVSGMFYEKDKNRVYLIGNEFEFEYYTFPNQKRFNLFKTFKYVHTLQNLYCSLIGQELQLNEKA